MGKIFYIRDMIVFFRLLLTFFIVFSLQNCLYSTHQFNNGRVLEAGKTRVTLGMGQQRYEDENLLKYSIDYHFGTSGPFWFFTGSEFGWHLEAPTNPGTMEFELRIGLPDGKGERWHHNLSGGWGIGMWADNSLFLGYAIGFQVKNNTVFSNIRFTRVATQFFKILQEDIDAPLRPDPKWVVQTAMGTHLELPGWPVIPSFIVPQLIITFPEIPAGPNAEKVVASPQMQVNFGAGWNF